MSKRMRAVVSSALFASVVATAAVIGCGGGAPRPNSAEVFVSILPQEYFVKQVAGDAVSVRSLVEPGQSPATYDPTPRQMEALHWADIFFRIGVPFEKAFVPRLKETYPDLTVIKTTSGIEKCRLGQDGKGGIDPHVWMDPQKVKKIARNMHTALSEEYPEHQETFEKNLEAFLRELDALDSEIAAALKPLKGQEFFVFHPSFGYFADAYGLNQVAIEIGGKQPSARHLQELIKKARERDVQVIFVQPQFSAQAAEAIADATGAAVMRIDPLAYDYVDNLRAIAGKVCEALDTGRAEDK